MHLSPSQRLSLTENMPSIVVTLEVSHAPMSSLKSYWSLKSSLMSVTRCVSHVEMCGRSFFLYTHQPFTQRRSVSFVSAATPSTTTPAARTSGSIVDDRFSNKQVLPRSAGLPELVP